jgi:hypothetical protein
MNPPLLSSRKAAVLAQGGYGGGDLKKGGGKRKLMADAVLQNAVGTTRLPGHDAAPTFERWQLTSFTIGRPLVFLLPPQTMLHAQS